MSHNHQAQRRISFIRGSNMTEEEEDEMFRQVEEECKHKGRHTLYDEFARLQHKPLPLDQPGNGPTARNTTEQAHPAKHHNPTEGHAAQPGPSGAAERRPIPFRLVQRGPAPDQPRGAHPEGQTAAGERPVTAPEQGRVTEPRQGAQTFKQPAPSQLPEAICLDRLSLLVNQRCEFMCTDGLEDLAAINDGLDPGCWLVPLGARSSNPAPARKASTRSGSGPRSILGGSFCSPSTDSSGLPRRNSVVRINETPTTWEDDTYRGPTMEECMPITFGLYRNSKPSPQEIAAHRHRVKHAAPRVQSWRATSSSSMPAPDKPPRAASAGDLGRVVRKAEPQRLGSVRKTSPCQNNPPGPQPAAHTSATRTTATQTTHKPVTMTTTRPSANLSVTKSAGNLTATRSSGNLTATRSAGNLTATKSSGNLTATRSAGNLTATKSTGNLSATRSASNLTTHKQANPTTIKQANPTTTKLAAKAPNTQPRHMSTERHMTTERQETAPPKYGIHVPQTAKPAQATAKPTPKLGSRPLSFEEYMTAYTAAKGPNQGKRPPHKQAIGPRPVHSQ
eukprot:TRINITY_DN22519_c0_g3_i1.p2 TRINITY_DN22519_c0_g3~~TRINITY_DN22519_c0_g3_i1.p2  ORF type:complete len:562 (+),score=172.39 TRINITY_DN22519_c0_g3_i1:117-1802(+)